MLDEEPAFCTFYACLGLGLLADTILPRHGSCMTRPVLVRDFVIQLLALFLPCGFFVCLIRFLCLGIDSVLEIRWTFLPPPLPVSTYPKFFIKTRR